MLCLVYFGKKKWCELLNKTWTPNNVFCLPIFIYWLIQVTREGTQVLYSYVSSNTSSQIRHTPTQNIILKFEFKDECGYHFYFNEI